MLTRSPFLPSETGEEEPHRIEHEQANKIRTLSEDGNTFNVFSTTSHNFPNPTPPTLSSTSYQRGQIPTASPVACSSVVCLPKVLLRDERGGAAPHRASRARISMWVSFQPLFLASCLLSLWFNSFVLGCLISWAEEADLLLASTIQ